MFLSILNGVILDEKWSADSLLRFREQVGLNFCQGTVCEMLNEPAKQIPDVIRYFGSRKKIFNVHFRNIRGHRLNFRETFPDEGDVNFLECARVYRDVGYEGMLMPDHSPQIEGDKTGLGFAFEIGYIQPSSKRSETKHSLVVTL
jgi:mannonate dehydratase